MMKKWRFPGWRLAASLVGVLLLTAGCGSQPPAQMQPQQATPKQDQPNQAEPRPTQPQPAPAGAAAYVPPALGPANAPVLIVEYGDYQ